MVLGKLTLHNTLSRKKESFKPIDPKKTLFYQCGPTVYWTQHIGNMRAMVMADLLLRTLKHLGYGVKFARNYTDVGHLVGDTDEGAEDKMAKGAKREGKTPQEIAQKYIEIFERDIAELNTLSPDIKPRATDFIPEMIAMVKTLLDSGFAYTTPLAVYFDISKAKDYTKLSGQILEDNLKDAGRGTVSDPNKKNPSDFALWFFKTGIHENAIQTWKNPFREKEGFPGWHIECSAMIKKILGETIDIHMGGIEHIPVHHTNEIAQSESANGVPLANYWIHNEHLLVNGKKMAKSEGTSFSLADVKEKGFNPLSLRYFFLNSHYKSKQNFTWEALGDAQNAYFGIIEKIAGILPKDFKFDPQKTCDIYEEKFNKAIANDLGAPEALAILWEAIKDTKLESEIKLNTILKFDEVLGLDLLAKAKDKKDVPDDIKSLAQRREEARQSKDWELADKLRREIESAGFEAKDSPSGPQITKKL